MSKHSIKIKFKPLELVERNGDYFLRWIDTRELPWREVYRESNDYRRIASAIKDMEIRGAPAIGVSAAYALALSAWYSRRSIDELKNTVREAYKVLASTRPTAYNLFWALRRIMGKFEELLEAGLSPKEVAEELIMEAKKIHEEDVRANMELGRLGATLIDDGDTILTHCNAGALATSGYGTAEGVIRAAIESGKKIRVIATETRPLLQGARLTVWELYKEGIDVTLITDNMVGYVMSKGLVDKVVVGADRITKDGYVANKIGTYTIAVIANRHRVPFYVAAPTSTFDPSIEGGKIPIEERDPDEVRFILGKLLITVREVNVLNPAFDITPPELVTAIISEAGIATPPYRRSIERLLKEAEKLHKTSTLDNTMH